MALLATFKDEHDQDDFTATYSAEDNKLRIYTPYRLEAELYKELRENGFIWAPKQEFFVAPRWTPYRENVCMIMAGDIEAEESTLAERAEAKAARFDGYRESRTRDANAYQSRANQIGERFAYGQPILVGHHSERKARNDQTKMHNAMDNSVKNLRTADYWAYRAEGVEHHAERKNSSRTRANRIKTLLKDLRDKQHDLSHYERAINTWERIQKIENEAERAETITNIIVGHAYDSAGRIGYTSAKDQLESGEKTPDEVLTRAIEVYTKALSSDSNTSRWIQHILNRLGYETELLGNISLYTDELTPTILQKFCRVHGADKPKAKKSENGFIVTSAVSLPLHIAESNELDLSIDEWCKLMKSCGYSVEANSPRKTARTSTPLLNIDTDKHVRKALYRNGTEEFEVIKMTKEEYKKVRTDNRGVCVSLCGQYRFKTVFINNPPAQGFGGYRAAVFITDSKAHPKPEAPEAESAA